MIFGRVRSTRELVKPTIVLRGTLARSEVFKDEKERVFADCDGSAFCTLEVSTTRNRDETFSFVQSLCSIVTGVLQAFLENLLEDTSSAVVFWELYTIAGRNE